MYRAVRPPPPAYTLPRTATPRHCRPHHLQTHDVATPPTAHGDNLACSGFRQSDDTTRAVNPFIVATRTDDDGYTLQLEGVNTPGTPLGQGETFTLPAPVTAKFVRMQFPLVIGQWISINEVCVGVDVYGRNTFRVVVVNKQYSCSLHTTTPPKRSKPEVEEPRVLRSYDCCRCVPLCVPFGDWKFIPVVIHYTCTHHQTFLTLFARMTNALLAAMLPSV